MFGLSEKEMAELTGIFRKLPHIEKVVVYGSRAMGNYRRFSDVDITLFGPNLSRDDLYKLDDLLYYSDLPYLFDISIFDELRDAHFIDHIRRRGKVMYERKAD